MFKYDDSFYQSKFDYYRKVSFYSALLTVLMQTTYFFTDCQIFGRFAAETFIPRFSVLLPAVILVIVDRWIKDYRVGAFLYYLFPHFAMWATIWAIWYLPNRDFAREGFVIMHFAFLAVGLAMPLKYHLLAHGILFINIMLSNLWIHYETYDLMMTLATPLYIGCVLVLFVLQRSYKDHYSTLQQIEKESVTDQLTGVYNRNVLHDIISEGSRTINMTGSEGVVILMMDIDKFKDVNDTYGHEAGDTILKLFVSKITDAIKDTDYLVRWGGEEFVVFLMNSSIKDGMAVAEKIRYDVEHAENDVCPVTVSIGVHEYHGGDYHNAIRKADIALYYAKENGRNMVVLDTDIPSVK
ncbi:MAG: GGDEF domain-containing protein [Lachnospiraceae bacterium]|nr:GGDEF domain-containing protein [Lachnospiraceae bacterium]